MSNDKMREEFEGWWNSEGQKITTGTKGDALIAWQAARAQPVDAIDTLSERVEKHCENRHDCQPADEAVAAQCRFEGEEWNPCTIEHHLLVQAHPKEWPHYETRALYTAPPAQVQDGWQLVPIEPTFEMLKAIDQHGEYYSEESLKDAYMDMLSAAPQPKGEK